MKDILYVIYLDKDENVTQHSYDIATLKVGSVNDRKYNFEIVEKHEDRLVIQWGYYNTNVVTVIKNGEQKALFMKDIAVDEDCSWYEVIETLGFCWVTEEEQ